MLTHFGVVPYLVFDGGRLPSKEGTEVSRAARREESRRLGEEHVRRGRMSQAHQELQKAVDVTPYMARVLIEELKKQKIQYLVAPYEADSQLVYLEKQGIINGIISEDSDMLVFGAKRLLSKLDKHGDCVELNRGDFASCRDISLIGWTDENFRQMCILSGCDYLPSIPKIGLKTAYRGIRKHKAVERVVKMIQFDGQTRVPPTYLEDFKRAELTFLHQRVFCPKERRLVMLNPLVGEQAQQDLSFLGDDIESETAVGIACGDLDPITREPINIIKQSYPERARMVRTGRQTLSSSTEKKPHKEIRDFFTPKRTPLAELDPNSLTPSPSQQQTMNRNIRRSWGANHVSTPPGVIRAASSIPTTPITRITETDTVLSRAARSSQPLSPKRQRLCSDADDRPTMKMTGERSRYFSPMLSGQSPLGQEQPGRKKFKNGSIQVFSDKAVEDTVGIQLGNQQPYAAGASRDLCGVDATSMKPNNSTTEETFAVKRDLTNQRQIDRDDSHPRYADTSHGETETLVKSHQEIPTLTPTTPAKRAVSVISEPELFDDMVQYHVKEQNSKLREQYAYTPGGEASNPTRVPKRPHISTSQTEDNTCGLLQAKSKTPAQRQFSRMTPLQRLRQNALGRSKSMNCLQKKEISEKDEMGYDSDSNVGSTSSFFVASTPHKGSEDMIIPNSDDNDADGDEGVGCSDEEKQQEKPRQLNLKKFEFEPHGVR